jgi:PAS domain-containing protein
MQGKTPSRHRFRSLVITALLTLYIIPIFLLGTGGSHLQHDTLSWRSLFLGGLFCVLGIWVFLLILKNWERGLNASAMQLAEERVQKYELEREQHPQIDTSGLAQEMRQKLTLDPAIDQGELINTLRTQIQQEVHEVSQEQIARLKQSYEQDAQDKIQHLQKLQEELSHFHKNNEQRSQEWFHKETEYRSYKTELEKQISQQENQLREFQQAFQEQKGLLQKKQERISFLENKIRDLTYEIRTLLQLEEITPSPHPREVANQRHSHAPTAHPKNAIPSNTSSSDVEERLFPKPTFPSSPVVEQQEVRTQYDAYVLLQKCLHVAQNLTGALHLGGNSSRFRDLSLDSYAIDLRRLFDSFRNETASVIILYSQTERRLLFANDLVRSYLGWSPERFVKDFGQIVQGGKPEWEAATATLTANREAHLRLVMRSKNGQDMLIHSCIGIVPSGAFQGLIIGILYRS